MKIIFLDIDGVICNHEQWKKHVILDGEYLHEFDSAAVKLLNELTDKTQAKFVISSTWRFKGVDILKKHFPQQGVTGEILDRTPSLRHVINAQRGDEIQMWLDENKDKEIESFVILDDDNDMKHLLPKLVQTLWINQENGELIEGLRQNHVDKAFDILNKPI